MNNGDDTIPHRDAPPPWFVIGCLAGFLLALLGIVFTFATGIRYLIQIIFGV